MENHGNFKLQMKLQKIIDAAPYSCRLKLKSLRGCGRYPLYANKLTHAIDVAVSETNTGRRHAHFIGLGKCKSVWACPVCSAQIINDYRIKITDIINHWRERGYKAHMVTVTIPHYRQQPAETVLNNLYKGLRKFAQSLSGYRKRRGIIGTIRAAECKYSQFNGWHFHAHILFFVPADFSATFTSQDNADFMEQHWEKSIADLYEHEVNRRYTKHSLWISKKEIINGDYIAKELAKTHSSNRAKKRACTIDPFELLESDDPRHHELFLEYAQAVHGHTRIKLGPKLIKGVQFTDLKKKAAEKAGVTSTAVVASFSYESWNEIVAQETDNEAHRLEILTAAEQSGFDGVFEYCNLHNLPLPHEPTYQYKSFFEAGG